MTRLLKQQIISLAASAIASVLASLWGSYLLRRVLGNAGAAEDAGEARPRSDNVSVVVIVFPVMAGNTMIIGAPGALRYLLSRQKSRKR